MDNNSVECTILTAVMDEDEDKAKKLIATFGNRELNIFIGQAKELVDLIREEQARRARAQGWVQT